MKRRWLVAIAALVVLVGAGVAAAATYNGSDGTFTTMDEYGSQGGPYSSTGKVWPAGAWEPYGSTSYWNKQLPAFGSSQLLNCTACGPSGTADTSASIMTYISGHSTLFPAQTTSWTFSNTPAHDTPSAWNHPLLWAKSTDPIWKIGTGSTCGSPNATFCPTYVRIPSGALAASQSDNHLSVVQTAGFYSSSGTDPHGRGSTEVDEVDFYQAGHSAFTPSGGCGTSTSNACAFSPAFDGGLDMNGAGNYGDSNATNTGLQGGTVTGLELSTGVIDHALAISFKCTDGEEVSPTSSSGATGTACASGGNGPPDGARFQYKKTDSQIDALTTNPLTREYLKAAAHYGVIVTDTGGSPWDPKFEPVVDYTPFESGSPSQSVMSWLATSAGGSQTDPYTWQPTWNWSDWQIVDPCYSTSAGC